jgi:putative tryptophan/tyrosine transport system substrate-binding protein
MRRRQFISVAVGTAAAWPLRVRAQQPPRPVIGLVGSATARQWAPFVAAFMQGLSETGIVEGQTVAIEYRWAEGQFDRLPAMAADLVQRHVSVIAALTTPAAVAAKAATSTTPIVFVTVSDPVQIGLVASLSHPGGNSIGATYLNVEVGPKLLELLHEVIPTATTAAALVNPTNPNSGIVSGSLNAAARNLGLQLHVLNVSNECDIESSFPTMVQPRTGGLVIVGDAFINTRGEQLAALALHRRVPTFFQTRAFVNAGGLLSYGGAAVEAYRQAGVYTGRVLKGEKPAHRPVQQTTKIELVIT